MTPLEARRNWQFWVLRGGRTLPTEFESVPPAHPRGVGLRHGPGRHRPARTILSSSTSPLAIDDAAITPDQHYAVLRQNRSDPYALVYALSTGQMVGSPTVGAFSEFCGEVLDAVAVANTRAIVLGGDRCVILDLANPGGTVVAEPFVGHRPNDVAIAPDARRALVTGNSTISLFHLGTGGQAFEQRLAPSNAYDQWCDGIAASADRAVGSAQTGPQNGWLTLLDTSPFATRNCTANPNSTGRSASIVSLGDASVSHNSLELCVDGAPRGARGRFVYGTSQTQNPFGDGLQCVGGTVFGMRFLETNLAGSAFISVNFASQQNPAGLVLPGSTWNYQFVFLDQGSQGFGVNSSDAISVTFAP